MFSEQSYERIVELSDEPLMKDQSVSEEMITVCMDVVHQSSLKDTQVAETRHVHSASSTKSKEKRLQKQQMKSQSIPMHCRRHVQMFHLGSN